MFDNIGSKIKALAQVFCWIGIVGSIIYGIVMLANSGGHFLGILLSAAVAGAGALISWISCFTLYGFGELIDRAQNIDEKLSYQPRNIDNSGRAASVDNLNSTGYRFAAPSGSQNAQKPSFHADKSDHWVCSKCGIKNEKTSTFCKNCGEYR